MFGPRFVGQAHIRAHPGVLVDDRVLDDGVVANADRACCTGAPTITTVDNPANRVGSFTSIAIDADGLPVISYYDSTADSLKVAKCAKASCAP